jgi:hypothetical protein
MAVTDAASTAEESGMATELTAEHESPAGWPDLIATLRCTSCRAINWRRGDLAIIGDLGPASRARLGVFTAAAVDTAGSPWRCDCGEATSGLAQAAGLDALLRQSLFAPLGDS